MPGLSDDSEAEFIRAVSACVPDGIWNTVRLPILTYQPCRLSGEAIYNAVCLAFDMTDLIVVIHNLTLYQEHLTIIYIADFTRLILSQSKAISIDNDGLKGLCGVVITLVEHVLDYKEFQLWDVSSHLSMLV